MNIWIPGTEETVRHLIDVNWSRLKLIMTIFDVVDVSILIAKLYYGLCNFENMITFIESCVDNSRSQCIHCFKFLNLNLEKTIFWLQSKFFIYFGITPELGYERVRVNNVPTTNYDELVSDCPKLRINENEILINLRVFEYVNRNMWITDEYFLAINSQCDVGFVHRNAIHRIVNPNLLQKTLSNKVFNINKCDDCQVTKGLWINLYDGHIGCSRRNSWIDELDGGNAHALSHYKSLTENNKPYTGTLSLADFVVKLGTICPDGADLYDYYYDCYCEDPLLETHLKHFGIVLNSMVKTEKSTQEITAEINRNFWVSLEEKASK